MSKNQFFNTKRFGLYIQNMILINYKKILLFAGVVFLVIYGLFFISMPKFGSQDIFTMKGYTSLFLFLIIACYLFIGSGFNSLSSKFETRNLLALPASTFEKYLAEFILRFLVGIVGIFTTFYLAAILARWTALATLTSSLPHAEQIAVFNLSEVWSSLFHSTDFPGLFILALSTLGILLFSVRIFFKKNGTSKTLLSLFGIFGILGLFSSFIFKVFSLNDSLSVLSRVQVSNISSAFDLFVIIFLSVVAIAALPLGYYKLKEKEL